MASTLKVYPNGLTAGVRPSKQCTPSGLKSDVSGWSLDSSRSNTRFLYSVRAGDLSGFGLALSLTVRECPETHEDWKRCREVLLMRLRRLGMLRLHWLTEWQRRGVPHMHAAVWFEDPGDEIERQRIELTVLGAWLAITAAYRSRQQSQTVARIVDEVGWLKYLSKHAARGAAHYQRAAQGIPQGWQKTGRMWGHVGSWPTDEPIALELADWPSWFRFRRLVRSYRLSQARREGKGGAIRAARRVLQCREKDAAAFRGVSEWVPRETALTFLDFLSREGGEITC